MKMTSKGEYGLRILIDLALHGGDGVITIKEIAGRTLVPVKYLEQILLQLKSLGYVASKRGANGGYQLRLPPAKIMCGEVIRAFEGPIAPVNCVSPSSYEPCSLEAACILRHLWLKVRNVVADILDSTSLADLIASSPK